uniref:C3H1-type domain-containing protein n=1 Tax=Panagrolaimus sp. ES5 TaxID=591445 RepID=A0AC34GX16_9BILA
MSLQIFPTFAAPPGNGGQNCYPMLYYAPPYPYQPQQHPPHYDPSTASFLAMPSLVPEQQPLYYTIDQHGNYVFLTPPNQSLPLSSEQSDISGGAEQYQLLLPTTNSDDSITSSQPNDPSPSFYDARHVSNMLNRSLGAVSRKSGGSGKSRNSPAYKTMMCNMFSTNGSCSYGAGCQYAHSKEEIRPTISHPKYKTLLCNKFSTPRGCQYGEKCHFRHPDDSEADLRTDSRQTKTSNGGGGNGKKKNGQKVVDPQSPASVTSMRDSAPTEMSATNGNKKEKKKQGNLIKLSMFHRFENYVGKNRKPGTLKRSNSSNSVGVFTFQRFAAMREVVNAQLAIKKQQNIGKPKIL